MSQWQYRLHLDDWPKWQICHASQFTCDALTTDGHEKVYCIYNSNLGFSPKDFSTQPIGLNGKNLNRIPFALYWRVGGMSFNSGRGSCQNTLVGRRSSLAMSHQQRKDEKKTKIKKKTQYARSTKSVDRALGKSLGTNQEWNGLTPQEDIGRSLGQGNWL